MKYVAGMMALGLANGAWLFLAWLGHIHPFIGFNIAVMVPFWAAMIAAADRDRFTWKT